MDELLTAEIGQVGTQWDGFAHPMIRIQGKPGWKDGNYFYNGVRLEDGKQATKHGMVRTGLLAGASRIRTSVRFAAVTAANRGPSLISGGYQP